MSEIPELTAKQMANAIPARLRNGSGSRAGGPRQSRSATASSGEASRACSRDGRNAALQIKVGQNRTVACVRLLDACCYGGVTGPASGRVALGGRLPSTSPESGPGDDHLRSDLSSVGKKLGSVGTDLGSRTQAPGISTGVTACDGLRDAFRGLKRGFEGHMVGYGGRSRGVGRLDSRVSFTVP